jgi:antitoxin ParD1/3/4
MTMIRKQIYIAPEHEAKIKRLVRHTHKSEAEIIRQAIEAVPEDGNPIISALRAQGLLVPREKFVTREEAEQTYRAYLEQIGNKKIGLTEAVLEERRQRY